MAFGVCPATLLISGGDVTAGPASGAPLHLSSVDGLAREPRACNADPCSPKEHTGPPADLPLYAAGYSHNRMVYRALCTL